MKRYQVYLNPSSISVLDDFTKISKIPKSRVIRDVVDRLAQQYLTIFTPVKHNKKNHYLLDELEGFIDVKTDKKTHFARDVDQIYDSL